MVLGTVLVIAALSLFLWNRQEAQQAEDAAETQVTAVEEAIAERSAGQAETGTVPDPYDTEMTVVEIDGYGYIGYLSIPALGLELPVMSEWSYPALRIAPCRYTGSTRTNDLVIAAHNYARHFGQIKNLALGDSVTFTDMDGTVWRYEVAAVELLEPTAVEEMTAGEYDLTLFTCTYGGASRVTVRCNQIEEGTDG